MKWRNSDQQWGLVSMVFHWLSALVIIGLFALGLWMTSLDYYDRWYEVAPDIHRSMGVLLFGFTLLRLLWRRWETVPQALPNQRRWEIGAAHGVHILLYLLLFSIMISGYLISTADGQGVQVFGWFEVPASIYGHHNQEDLAGEIHEWLAFFMIALVLLHSAAALKHHFLDRDATLRRMLGLGGQNDSSFNVNHSKE